MKNLKQVVTNALLVVLSVMMLGFGAGYYLAGTAELRGGSGGYDFLQRLLDGLKGPSHVSAEVYVYVVGMIMVLIFVSLLIVLALLSLLCNFDVIKSEKVSKWLNILKLVVAVCALLAFIMIWASVLKMIQDFKFTVGYGLIINVVLSVLSIAVLVFELILSRKKSM